MQEYEKFARFTDSLLSRSSKLTDLSQQLENGLVEAGKDCESSEGKRVSKLDPKFFTQLSLKHKNIVNNFCMHVKIWCWWFGTPDWLRLVQNLDAATETLEAEYEKCDKVKLDVSSLRSNKGLPESTVTEFLEWKLVVNNTTNKSLDVWTKIVHNSLSMFLALSPTAHQVHSPGM